MTKLAQLVISGTLFSSALVATPAFAADKAPAAAPAAATAPSAAPAAKPAAAPVAAAKPAAAPVAAAKPAAAPASAPIATKETAPAGKPAAPATAPAAAAAPPAMPAPAPEVESLYKGYEGSWKCETTFAANAMGPGSPELKAKTEVKIKKEKDGYWYKGEYKIKKSKTTPEMAGTFMLGYDTAAKEPVSINVDSMGGYSVQHAAGGTAEKISFVGDGAMMGAKVKFRETMSAKSAKEIEHTFEADMGKGFQPMGVDVCKK